mgnify:CR=1 FL=1
MSEWLEHWRLGSFIDSKTYGICKLAGFYRNRAWVIANFGEHYEISIEDLSPIRLTLSWIEALGFEFFESRVIPLDSYDCDEEVWGIWVDCGDYSDYSFRIKLLRHPGWIEVLEMSVKENHNDSKITLADTYWLHSLTNAFFQVFEFDLKIVKPEKITS